MAGEIPANFPAHANLDHVRLCFQSQFCVLNFSFSLTYHCAALKKQKQNTKKKKKTQKECPNTTIWVLSFHISFSVAMLVFGGK